MIDFFDEDRATTRAVVTFLSPELKTCMKRTRQNGYGSHHKRLREQFRPLVESGQAVCPGCGEVQLISEFAGDRSKASGRSQLLQKLRRAAK